MYIYIFNLYRFFIKKKKDFFLFLKFIMRFCPLTLRKQIESNSFSFIQRNIVDLREISSKEMIHEKFVESR